jgi:hypothetical protein
LSLFVEPLLSSRAKITVGVLVGEDIMCAYLMVRLTVVSAWPTVEFSKSASRYLEMKSFKSAVRSAAVRLLTRR